MDFEYEIGLVPSFELDLDGKNDIVKYIVKADDKLIDGQVERIQKQFGTPITQEVVVEGADLKGIFTNEAEGIGNSTTINLSVFKDKATADKFIGKKVGDVVTVNTKGLFQDDHQLMDYLKVGHDNVHGLAIDVDFTIEAITTSEPAELNQELFDKLFGAGNVASLEELKTKIKEDAEVQFAQQADQKLLGDVTEFLIENTKFDLPSEFLKKWLQTVGEKKLSPEEAEVEYARSEKGLRFQLIEGKAMSLPGPVERIGYLVLGALHRSGKRSLPRAADDRRRRDALQGAPTGRGNAQLRRPALIPRPPEQDRRRAVQALDRRKIPGQRGEAIRRQAGLQLRKFGQERGKRPFPGQHDLPRLDLQTGCRGHASFLGARLLTKYSRPICFHTAASSASAAAVHGFACSHSAGRSS